ncbi:MAG: MEDS domain-containing protein [Gemmatimonadales bacterium]
MTTELPLTIPDLSHGDHCCLLYTSEQDQIAVTVPFLATGLERDEKSLYVGSPRQLESIRDGLADAGVNVEREARRGRLVLDSGHDYLDQGRWITDRMLGFLQQAYDATLAEGYAALRAVGDVSWQVGPRQDYNDVVYYEALLDVFFLGKRMVGICQYPRDRCPPDVLSGILNTHRTAFLDSSIYANFHYTAPEVLLEKDEQVRQAKRVEWMTSQLRRVRESEAERQRLETQLHHSQKMEAIGRLAGGVAHDFNNLLMVISGNCELAARAPSVPPAMRESLQEIQEAATRAAALSRQLLAFSRKQVLEPRLVDLNRVVGDIERLLRRLIGEDIELVIRLVPGLHPVFLDPGNVEQIIVNLAVNARDAMPQGGILTLETANVHLDAEYAREHPGVRPGPHVMLAVSDTGTGMTREVQAQIFEPFFTTKGVHQGTGLGLSTVYGIVKQSGGDVWVYSEAGRGTTFKVYLPRGAGETAEPIRPAVSAPARAGGTILVIEDDPSLRRLLRRVLEEGGYTVLDAPDGAQAVETYTSHQERIDLVLTDVVLPDMGGRELADRLGSLRSGLKVAFMSGYTDETVVRYGGLEPGMAFIEKPVRPEQLLQKVAEFMA